jgi:predicted Fe-Mo cluster-binding NifX family protein
MHRGEGIVRPVTGTVTGKQYNFSEGDNMKVAVSAAGPELSSEVDPRFGRCRYFIVADTEDLAFKAIDNTSAMSMGGAGVSAAQMVAGEKVEAVLTGHCGPNAYQALSLAGIKIITDVSGKVKDAISGYKPVTHLPAQQPDVPDHFGMTGGPHGKGGPGGHGGHGMGRGMGRQGY